LDEKNWLRRFRDQVGLSQEEVKDQMDARGFEVSRSSISHWESNAAKPPLGDPVFRKALADVMRVSVPDLLAAAGYEVTDLEWSVEARRAAWIVDQLSEKGRALALELLNTLLAQEG
jgi:transcriptional regulator with XRE-family HTH domain